MKKKIYLLLGFALIDTTIMAQQQLPDSTLARTVVVEQEYNPIIGEAKKINATPKVEIPIVNTKQIEYDTSLLPATHIPTGIVPNYTGKEIQEKRNPGYLRLGYGNNGYLDIFGNYLFMPSEKDKIGLSIDVDGMDWEPLYHYRTKAGINYSHAFEKINFNTAAHFGLSNFNLLYDRQRYNSGDVHIGFSSTDTDMSVQFKAETNLLLYNRAYNRHDASLKETVVRTKADVFAPLKEYSTMGLAMQMDNIFNNYGKKPDYRDEEEYKFNYTTVGLNPYYRFENEAWKVRLGAHIDLAFGHDAIEQFNAAPDILVQYATSRKSHLYLQATGGHRLNDFRRLEALSPYSWINHAFLPGYEQLNASAGFRLTAENTPGIHLFGGYQVMKNEVINFWDTEIGGPAISNLYVKQGDLNNLYVGGELSLTFSPYVSLQGSLIYHLWEGKEKIDDYYLYFMPAIDVEGNIEIHPIDPLQIEGGIRYIGRSKNEAHNNEKAPAYINLYAETHYQIGKTLGIYARATNLLDRANQYYWGYPCAGLSIMGGITLHF